jgi:hypothetical protein
MAPKSGNSPAGKKHPEEQGVYFDSRNKTIVVQSLIISDPEVIAQARLYADEPSDTPQRATNAMEKADLTQFLMETVSTGARTMAIIQRDHQADLYTRQLNSVASQALRDLKLAMEELVQAAEGASEKLGRSSAAALRNFKAARTALYEDFNAARKALHDEVHKLIGGETPEVLALLEPVINKKMNTIEKSLTTLLTDGEALIWSLLEDSADPDNPKSLVARVITELKQNQNMMARMLSELKSSRAAESATKETINRSTLKGAVYEDQLAGLLTQIATGLGYEYLVTRNQKGNLTNTKGDGVLALNGGDVRVVVEMMDSDKKRDWNGYMSEAERNRGGTGSIGFVRHNGQNENEFFRTIGGSRARRFVVAFDPIHDDPALLRTIVQLACGAALAAGDRTGSKELFKAQELIAAAIGDLDGLNKSFGDITAIQSAARSIERRTTSALTTVDGLLQAALAALNRNPDL